MSTAGVLVVAMVLDALLGEPRWLWQRVAHPAVLMGRLVSWLERRLNHGGNRRWKGVLAVAVLILVGSVIGGMLTVLGPIVACLVVAVLLAQKSLVEHVRAVSDGLRMSLAQGRRAVAMIVSRDTDQMTEDAAARSAIESAAENLSDGVIAPAFWYLIGGLPGILIYKLVNTADSMVGYRTPRYEAFGWAAARLDDVLNWVPARMTAVLIALPAWVISGWGAIRADARLHKSPNAGWPEAAMARAIDVALAGPRAYDGVMRQFAWVNPDGQRHIGAVEIDGAIRALWRAWGVMLALVVLLVVI